MPSEEEANLRPADSESLQRIVPIYIIGPQSWKAFGILNPNAFVPHLRPYIYACADKLALVSYSLQIVERQVDLDRESFVNQLNHYPSWYGFTPDADKPAVAVYHNMGFHAGIQSFFITMKSVLDIYARVISKSIEPGSSLFGFNKAPYQGKKMVGGRLLNWIENSAPESYTKKHELVGVLRRHIDDWVSSVVKHRNDIVHEGTLRGLLEMNAYLSKSPKDIGKDDIVLPAIAEEEAFVGVFEYCQDVQNKAHQMFKETLVMLPNVDVGLLAL